MALTNHERIGKGIELLTAGLKPFVVKQLQGVYKDRWTECIPLPPEVRRRLKPKQIPNLDAHALLGVIWDEWHQVFKNTLGPSERSLVSELRDVRNHWAHQKPFSTDDAYRALDSMGRLLSAVSAEQAAEVDRHKQELLRIRFEETARKQTRKAAGAAIEGKPQSGLQPWREVVTPHPDVASGRYQQAEFAADLWQVYCKEAADEYQNPGEFFRRTFLTEGLRRLLLRAIQRLGGSGGDPVVQLQTNFGGGKTHSMLALYHLFSGEPVTALAGMEEVQAESGYSRPPKVNRAVLVGTRIAPSEVHKKPDGTKVHTLWGELAWQLGGKEGYKLVKQADQTGTSPGDALRELFILCSPCLILIDEWVAYARQLYRTGDLPAGTFDAHFTFAQALTEAAKAAPNTLLVVSVPASQIEVGGEGGELALDRLKNAVGRIEASWRPAGVEESFEIVRRRLFQPLEGREKYVARDTVARAFVDSYRSQQEDFPLECREAAYEERIKKAYPIHPELLDRLYDDWSTLDKFQRTRGVLRLMATVIHTLWERQDPNLLILPATVPLDDSTVQFELTRYLEDPWVPVIETDVDGPHSLPLRIDRENANFGRYSACRRVARTIFMGSAPTLRTSKRGLEDRKIRLGCVQPGESPSTFGDALRRLGDQATHLYADQGRYWFSTQPSVLRVAQERAERLDQEAVFEEIRKRLKKHTRQRGEFERVHTCPSSYTEVPDDRDACLVVLGPEYPHVARSESSPALEAAGEILKQRAGGPRNYPNALVFLAADQNALKDLDMAVRQWLAWKSIVAEHDVLNLDAFQENQAKSKLEAAEQSIESRIPETYIWVLSKDQPDPQKQEFEWHKIRAAGGEPLAVKASRKLVDQGQLMPQCAGMVLRRDLDKIPLWDGNHVRLEQLAEYHAKYLYLPRLKNAQVLVAAVEQGAGLLTWQSDTFAYADGWNEEKKRYQGLRAGKPVQAILDRESVIVKPEAATTQLEAETAAAVTGSGGQPAPGPSVPGGGTAGVDEPGPEKPKPSPKVRRFHGAVELNAKRAANDASTIAQEVIQHIESLVGANVAVTLEIQAEIPDGVPERVVRTVTENCRTLKFKEYGFEEE